MGTDLKVSLIGLDTSHTMEFVRRLNDPDCEPDQKVEGMRAVTCLRFPTPFQSEEAQDQRQILLESWGVKVVTDFNEAVADCDAIMIEINDPAYHLEYFAKCAPLGKPVFLDKPLADNIENGIKIMDITEENKLRMFSSSPMRFSKELINACNEIPKTEYASVYGAVGEAPAGSSIIWYGVHAFEMLQHAMGIGAIGVFARPDKAGVVVTVEYPDGRRGVVELTTEAYYYGGCLRDSENGVSFTIDFSPVYSEELRNIVSFFKGSDAPVALDDTLEVMALLDTAHRSAISGKYEEL